MTSELLPCPFCGSHDLHAFDHHEGEPSFGYQCGRCWMTSSHHHSRDEALTAWNTRAKADQIMGVEAFQPRVRPWMHACFGETIPCDRQERGDRLLEEVFELLQSGGYDKARVAELADYTWGRPAGEPHQEVGGVMVTLAAYCLAHGLDMHEAGETELARIWTKVDAIRAKQAAKPRGIALPVDPETLKGPTNDRDRADALGISLAKFPTPEIRTILTALASANERADRAERERGALKLQAQSWAMEARAHEATVHEAYQAVTGATGEPGNWNGAVPIRAALEAAEAALVSERERADRAERERDGLRRGQDVLHLKVSRTLAEMSDAEAALARADALALEAIAQRDHAEAALATAERERDEARDRSLESNMLAHRWMVAHDRLKAGEPYDFPAPADLPAAEAALATAERERDEALTFVLNARADQEAAEAALAALKAEVDEALQIYHVGSIKDALGYAYQANLDLYNLKAEALEVVGPFLAVADEMDDCDDLNDDPDQAEHVTIGFAGMRLGEMLRDDFRAARAFVDKYRGEG